MSFVCEVIVAVVMRSLCLPHFENFEELHRQIPVIHERFSQLHPRSDLINLLFALFPGYLQVMTIQRWKEVHAWSTDDNTEKEYGEMFQSLTAYAIDKIKGCPRCQAFSSPDPTDAIRFRHSQAFRRLYEEVGLGWVYAITKYEPIASIANAVYGVWAKYRMEVTGRPSLEEVFEARRKNRGEVCKDKSCDI